jgi:hypothetical protein
MATREERQNRGYDEAVRGKPPVKLDIMDTTTNDHESTREERRIDRAANEAANDVRRHEHSAD